MTEPDLERTISAAWDGEPVDLDALRAALRTPEGRELLASYALIRAMAAAQDIDPNEDGPARLHTALAARRRGWLVEGPTVPARLVASLAAVAVGAALWIGIASRPQLPAAPGRDRATPVGAGSTPPTAAVDQAPPAPTGGRAVAPGRRAGAGSHPRPSVLDETPPTPTRTIPLVPADSGF